MRLHCLYLYLKRRNKTKCVTLFKCTCATAVSHVVRGGRRTERLHNCSGATDHNSCAVMTTKGSSEGLAQMHIHPLSHEATFNLESILAWEKRTLFIFIFFISLFLEPQKGVSVFILTHI